MNLFFKQFAGRRVNVEQQTRKGWFELMRGGEGMPQLEVHDKQSAGAEVNPRVQISAANCKKTKQKKCLWQTVRFSLRSVQLT